MDSGAGLRDYVYQRLQTLIVIRFILAIYRHVSGDVYYSSLCA